MTQVRHTLKLLLGLVSICIGIWILITVGLPQRSEYTGFQAEEIGYVAPEINNRAPPFTLSTIDLESLALSDVRAPVIIINFWATWCAPCRDEMQQLQALYQENKDEIRILGVNLGESPKAVTQWVAEFNLTYDILLDPLQSVAQLYQIRGQPSTYILDTEHRIRVIYYGPVGKEQLEGEISNLLNQ